MSAPSPHLPRIAPVIAALVLAAFTTAARQWEDLVQSLPRTPHAGVFRTAPSGNEWRLRVWRGFGADRAELRRTYTVNTAIDPLEDARSTFARTHDPVPPALLQPPAPGPALRSWKYARWGWPMRHAGVDQRGRRHIFATGFIVNTLTFTPLWLLVLHLVRRPVVYLAGRLRTPPWACRECRYDLRGLPDDAPCPECGHARPTPPP